MIVLCSDIRSFGLYTDGFFVILCDMFFKIGFLVYILLSFVMGINGSCVVVIR
jgi:hypothetical protein